MTRLAGKPARFAWRTARNLACMTPWGRKALFPVDETADCFGPDDAGYAIDVFLHHVRQLTSAGFRSATTILEIGPGRNLGTSLLMWAMNHSRASDPVTLFLWDVFPNMSVTSAAMREAAAKILEQPGFDQVEVAASDAEMKTILHAVAQGEIDPDIRYLVTPLAGLKRESGLQEIELVYSHAAVEHIWEIADFWERAIGLTADGGWHSHRIDLADHGRRDTNYVEMLEWSAAAYWMMMRFVPGAINRWRASMHVEFVARKGLKILVARPEVRPSLPIAKARINRALRTLDEADLLTVALDLVAVKPALVDQGTEETPRSVAMFCPQFRPIIGGAERQAERLAVELVRRGHHVIILTPRTDAESPGTENIDGVRLIRFPLRDLSTRSPVPGIGVLNLPFIVWQTVRQMRPHLKDVSILHCTIASLQTAAAAVAGRLAGIPVICKAAMGDERSDIGAIERTGLSGKLVAWLVRRSIQKWIATTEAVEQGLIRAGIPARKIVRIPNGVPLPAEPVHLPGTIRRFLYLGRLSRNIDRDVPTLLAAFDRLARTNPEVELAVVGGGDLLDETVDIAAALASRERIHLPGFDDSARWLAWADGFVLPSRREGLSNALLEAMAAGLPCIANDIPPNREVLAGGSAGILVPIGDRQALEDAMRLLHDDPAMAALLAGRARERVITHYSIAGVAQQHASLYASMLARN
jgi:L-malate glycosyltransferase